MTTPAQAVQAANLPAPSRGGPGRDKTKAQARRAQAVSLALSGLDYARIAELTGYASSNSAYNAVRAALDQVVIANVDELRRKQSAQLDRLLLATWQNALQGDAASIREARKLLDSKARLLGLNAPVQVEDVTGIDSEIGALRVALSADLAADGSWQVTDMPVEGAA